MSTSNKICEQLQSLWQCEERGGVVIFNTLLQYPSGSLVRVHFRPSGSRWGVSDNGGAFQEVAAAGIDKPSQLAKLRKMLRQRGLTLNDGEVLAPSVDFRSLPRAAIAVANATRDAADLVIGAGRDERVHSIEVRTRNILVQSYKTLVSSKPVTVVGRSEKKYSFSNALHLPDDRLVLIDTVNHHANSINSAVVNNLDIRRQDDPRIVQRIVFDPEEDWKSEEISLLTEGAQPVALTALPASINRIWQPEARLH